MQMAKSGKKKLFGLVFIILILVLAFPISNLVVGTPENSLSNLRTGDPLMNRAVAVMAGKCVNCHSEEAKLPFYGNFPIAKGMIEEDIREGTAYMDLVDAIGNHGDRPVSEVVLAKIERTAEKKSMPPMKYVLLHWNAALGQQDREDLDAWINQTREKHYATPGAAPEFKSEVIQPLPQTLDIDPAKVALGNELYHDTRLSKDNTLSCASCHDLNKGGTDQEQFSDGVDNAMGDINSPTTFNSGYQFVQFWDGRAPTLEEQAKGPVENPIEMADKWDDVVAELSKDEDFVKRFTAVYPSGVKVDNIVSAIADFERSLITPNCKFDKYLMGEADALTAEEKEGYRLFKENDCATCHVGKAMGGQSFETMGRKADYFAKRGNVHKPDFGRFNETNREEDKHKFKVPTLRNIAVTYPYFHDGSTSDLAEVVQTMAECECGVTLKDQEVKKIVSFLRTLTGEYQGKLLQ
jgi:cytochrome c peroxidase